MIVLGGCPDQCPAHLTQPVSANDPSAQVTPTPEEVVIPQGESRTVALTIARKNFDGAVKFNTTQSGEEAIAGATHARAMRVRKRRGRQR